MFRDFIQMYIQLVRGEGEVTTISEGKSRLCLMGQTIFTAALVNLNRAVDAIHPVQMGWPDRLQ